MALPSKRNHVRIARKRTESASKACKKDKLGGEAQKRHRHASAQVPSVATGPLRLKRPHAFSTSARSKTISSPSRSSMQSKTRRTCWAAAQAYFSL